MGEGVGSGTLMGPLQIFRHQQLNTRRDVLGIRETWVFLTTFYTLTADTQLWTIACSHVYTRNNTKYHSRLHWQSATGSAAIVKPHTHHGAWLRLASGLWVILHTPPPCIPCHISVLDLWRFIKRMEEGILDFHCFLASDKRAKKANTNSSTSVN